MIIKNLKRIVLSVITIAAIFAVNPMAAHAEWKEDSTGWWYSYGDSWYTGWEQIDGKWYYFNSNGYMAHDCYINNYYLNSEGYWDTSVQGFSVKYPSSWIKSTSSSGNTLYYIDNKGTNVNEVTASLQGKSRQEGIDESIKRLKSDLGIDQVSVSEQTINGRTVDVLDYKYNKSNMEIQVHQVVFYNNNLAYIFTIGGIANISSEDMDSFNDMLKTVTF